VRSEHFWKSGELIDRRFHHVCVAHSVIFTARALVFLTVRLPKFYRAPDALRRCGAYIRAVLTRNSAQTARLVRTKTARAQYLPARRPTGALGWCPPTPPTRCPSQVAPRATREALLAHTHPLAEHPNLNPKHPSTDLPPRALPPPRPGAAGGGGTRSLAADCESAGSTQCLLAATTWCQRWQPALATCVHAPAPPATPLSAESQRAVAAAAGTRRRPLARRRARKTSSWAVLEVIGMCGWC